MSNHRRCVSSKSPEFEEPEEISDKIDRLNFALEQVMKEIEISSASRNASRMSTVNLELYQDSVFHTEEESEEPLFQSNYEETIEKLLQKIDRQQMIIEDLASEDKRIVVKDRQPACGPDINKVHKQIWLQVSKPKADLVDKERTKFETELKKLDELKDDYYNKRREILLGIEKLKIKEQLLDEKEKQLRMQRLTFEKQKLVWEQEHGIESKPALIELSSGKSNHCRSASFSYSLVQDTIKGDSKSKHLPMEIKPEQFSPSKLDQLKIYQNELKAVEDLVRGSKEQRNEENEMKMENLRNRIAALRGEIAISESSKATRLINCMMVSLQREVKRDEKGPCGANGRNLAYEKRPAMHARIKPMEVKDDEGMRKKMCYEVDRERSMIVKQSS